MKSFFSGKLAVLLLFTAEVYYVAATSIRTSSFIETAAHSYTGASSSLHHRYATVNDNNAIEPTILTDIMSGGGGGGERRRQKEEVLDNNNIIEIDTYFHVLIMNETNGDDVDEETINKQLTVLNEAYGGMENSMYKDCNGNPTKSYETGFRFKKGGETTRTYVADLEDESFLKTITEDELINLYLLLEQGSVVEDLSSSLFENFLQNQTFEEQIMTLVELPNAGLTYIPFLFGKKVRGSSSSASAINDDDDDDDDCTKLHIYIQPGQITPIFGYATTPWNCRQMNELYVMDGIFIHRGTLPDSNFKHPNTNSFLGLFPAEEYLSWSNQGDTAVHEVGHWLGLTHTFAGATMNTTTGCDIYGGDEILDTPAQEDMGPIYCTERPCCNLEQDTCPHIPGTDPVWNFMDYSDDCCMERFTPMQAEKMRFSWKLYRADFSMDTAATATSNGNNNDGNDNDNDNDNVADASVDDGNTAAVSGGATVSTNTAGISMSGIVAVVAYISMMSSSFS